MKKILGTLAYALGVIESIILEPITLVFVLGSKYVLHYDDMKFRNAYLNYRWLVLGWWCKMNGVSKDEVRNWIQEVNY